MGKTEKRLAASISCVKRRFGDSTQIAQFEKVTKEFEQLVKRGVTKKRGNNLLSPGDPTLTKHFANVPNGKSIDDCSNFFNTDFVK